MSLKYYKQTLKFSFFVWSPSWTDSGVAQVTSSGDLGRKTESKGNANNAHSVQLDTIKMEQIGGMLDNVDNCVIWKPT